MAEAKKITLIPTANITSTNVSPFFARQILKGHLLYTLPF